MSLGWTWGVGLGFFLGCWAFGFWPAWPPVGDRERWLTILLPATLIVGCLTAGTHMPGWWVWLPRLLLAAAATPILLFGTSYVADIAGPGTREWPLPQALLIMSGLAATLVVVWYLVEQLQYRTAPAAVGAALFLTTAAAGIAVMHSGYTTGGQMGIALAGSLAGASAAAFLLAGPALKVRLSGAGLVGLFGVIIVGRFFGTLPNRYAVFLMLAPLMPWLTEFPGVRRLSVVGRTVLGLILVALPLILPVGEGLKAAFNESSPDGEVSAEL